MAERPIINKVGNNYWRQGMHFWPVKTVLLTPFLFFFMHNPDVADEDKCRQQRQCHSDVQPQRLAPFQAATIVAEVLLQNHEMSVRALVKTHTEPRMNCIGSKGWIGISTCVEIVPCRLLAATSFGSDHQPIRTTTSTHIFPSRSSCLGKGSPLGRAHAARRLAAPLTKKSSCSRTSSAPSPPRTATRSISKDGASDDQEVLDLKRLAKSFTCKPEWGKPQTERLNRPAIAASTLAGSVEETVKTIKAVFPSKSEMDDDNAQKKFFLKSGIPGFLSSMEVSDLAQSLHTLNMANDEDPNKEDLKKAYQTLISDVTDGKVVKPCQNLAICGAKMLQASLNVLEVSSLFEHREAWTKELWHVEKTTSALKAFIKNPMSDSKLLASLVEQHLAQAKKDKGREKKRTELRDPSEDSEREATASKSSASSDGSSSPVQGKKKTTKKKKEKKAKKESSDDSPSSSSADKKKNKKDKKKDNKNKDGKKRRASSSESEGTKKAIKTWQKAEEQAMMAEASLMAKMAAATTWPLGEVQKTGIATENMLAALADPSVTSVASIQQMALAIPSDALEAFGLTEHVNNIALWTKVPKNDVLKPILQSIKAAAAHVKRIYEALQGKSSGAGAKAKGKATPKAAAAAAAE